MSHLNNDGLLGKKI